MKIQGLNLGNCLRAVAAIIVSITLVACVTTRDSPADVTDQDISSYRIAMDHGCRDAGAKRGDSQMKIDKFCGCVVETLSREVTPAEWRQAVLHAQRGHDQDEMKILAPHLQKVEQCRAIPVGLMPESSTPPSQVSSSQYQVVKKLADSQPRDEYGRYMDAWDNVNNSNHLDELGGCYGRGNGAAYFVLILDEAGQVADISFDGNSDKAQCFGRTYMHYSFPKPPRAPYYLSLTFN
jgi:hypothetical protein